MSKEVGIADNTRKYCPLGMCNAVLQNFGKLLIIPRIAKWFFRKLESEKYSQYIFVLSVVFFASFLAEVAGVEPIIGAFLNADGVKVLVVGGDNYSSGSSETMATAESSSFSSTCLSILMPTSFGVSEVVSMINHGSLLGSVSRIKSSKR